MNAAHDLICKVKRVRGAEDAVVLQTKAGERGGRRKEGRRAQERERERKRRGARCGLFGLPKWRT